MNGCVLMRTFSRLITWALAYELGDSEVRDRGIVEELSALLQAPVADHGIVYRTNSLKTASGMRCFGSIEAKKA